MKNSNNFNTRSQAGVAAVEFTILLPFVLFLTLAVTEVSRAFMHYNTLTQSIRDSARYVASRALLGQSGAVNIDNQLRAEGQSVAVYGTIDASGSSVLPGLSIGDVSIVSEGNANFSITASYAYQPLFSSGIPGFVGAGMNAGFTMQAGIVMKAL